MNLPSDTQRCTGHSINGTLCSRRNQCLRYLQKNNGGQNTPIAPAPENPNECEIYKRRSENETG